VDRLAGRSTLQRARHGQVSLALVFPQRISALLAGSAVLLASCGSANAQPVPARSAGGLKPTPTTTADRKAAHEFYEVNWSNVRYPSLLPHCHVTSDTKVVEHGTVVGYVLTAARPIALVTATCGINRSALPNGLWAFAPPASSTNPHPILLDTLVRLPPSPLQHDSPTSVLYFTNLLPGDQQARAIPSPPGTTTHAADRAQGPILSIIDCYTQGPQFVHGSSFTVVGLTGVDYAVPDQPPAAMESLEFAYHNGTFRLKKRLLTAVARYSCP
jgi:hypothetical protein